MSDPETLGPDGILAMVRDIIGVVETISNEMMERLGTVDHEEADLSPDDTAFLADKLDGARADIAELHQFHADVADWPPIPEFPPGTSWFMISRGLGVWVTVARSSLSEIDPSSVSPRTKYHDSRWDRVVRLYVEQNPGKAMVPWLYAKIRNDLIEKARNTARANAVAQGRDVKRAVEQAEAEAEFPSERTIHDICCFRKRDGWINPRNKRLGYFISQAAYEAWLRGEDAYMEWLDNRKAPPPGQG